VGNTENTTTKPGINVAIVSPTVRVKRGGAVKVVSSFYSIGLSDHLPAYVTKLNLVKHT
jgi:hypothetical protein